jgi:hypothetical protein
MLMMIAMATAASEAATNYKEAEKMPVKPGGIQIPVEGQKIDVH